MPSLFAQGEAYVAEVAAMQAASKSAPAELVAKPARASEEAEAGTAREGWFRAASRPC